MQNQKTAVVIFNLGGPSGPDAIQPFLFNLFNDPFIISWPAILRTPLAWLISSRRAPKVKPLYDHMGGASPIQKHTAAQADALQTAFGNDSYKVFTGQRYWHPMADETVRAVKAWGADKVILLPLYPQFSTTTTTSYVSVWDDAARKHKLKAETEILCCYPLLKGFIDAQVELVRPVLENARQFGAPRILFSAHGLPKKIVDGRGDPYPLQVEITAAAMAAQLGLQPNEWKVTYQSRVGPVEWIKPYTDKQIQQAGAEKKPLVLVPLSFVSDHLETLVELDIEYKHLADAAGVPFYGRVAPVYLAPQFINALKDLVLHHDGNLKTKRYVAPSTQKVCPGTCQACPHNKFRAVS